MDKKRSSYNQILRSTGIFGSSQLVNIVLGMLRTKVIALLLGPAGIGLIGLYQSIVDMVRSVTNLGIETATIKEVAKSSEEDERGANRVITIFNRCFLFTAILGALVCIAFSKYLSLWAFDNTDHTLSIIILSSVVFITGIAAGRSAILQGLRKISYMAKATVAESIFTLLIVVPLYYFFGINAIIPALRLNSVVVLVCVYFFYRKLRISDVYASKKEVVKVGLGAFKLGIFILLGGIINTGSMFFLRAHLSTHIDIASVGIFQSAWAITAVFTGLILGATGTDFFPRLCAVEKYNGRVRKLVNQQTYIVLILASPIIIGILLLFPLIIYILYSSAFIDAKEVLQWQIVGAYFKILATPIASILLAKHKGLLYLLSEFAFFAVYLLISFLLLDTMGIEATGIAYLVAYVVYLILIFVMGKSTSSFRWSGEVLKIIAVNILFIVAGLFVIRLNTPLSIVSGGILFISNLLFSYNRLKKVFDFSDIKLWFKKK